MPRTAQNIPKNETDAQKFVRLANHRVNTILRSYKQLGQLGGKQYQSLPEQRKKIETVLTEALSRAMQAMSKGETVQDFKL
jgi:light-regulated signal transduction histidine kinase (bacteriophytochrome)